MGERTLDGKSLFCDKLELIDSVVTSVGRRGGLPAEDIEDFRSDVYLHLIKNDYAVLRSFRGGSSLRTYLSQVVRNLLLDRIIRKRGKWRPSCQALKTGGEAVLVERLFHWESRSVGEIVAVLRAKGRDDWNGPKVEALLQRLPKRKPRPSFLAFEDSGQCLPGHHFTGERLLIEKEARLTASRIAQLLGRELGSLPKEDRMVLKLRFSDGLPVPAMAQQLSITPKRLYRRIDHLVKTLRNRLDSADVGRFRLDQIIGNGSLEISFHL